MGILGKLGEAIGDAVISGAKGLAVHGVKNIAADVADSVLNSEMVQKIEKKGGQKVQQYIDNTFVKDNPDRYHLLINQHSFTWSDHFDIYDANWNIRYKAKGNFFQVKHHLTIMDPYGKELAKIKEKLISVRAPLSLDSDPADFEIKLFGKNAGTLKTRGSFMKRAFTLTFTNNRKWNIVSNYIASQYYITEGPYEIAHARMKTLYWGDTYVIDYVNPVDELLVLICMLCIDASDAPSRSDELKKTLRHKLLY